MHTNMYGVWKPYLIEKTLNAMPDGAILLYCDAGCMLMRSGMKRFHEYLDMMKDHDLLVFNLPLHPEKAFTKMSVLRKLNADTEDIKESGQIMSGVSFWKNSDKTRQTARDWYTSCCDYHNIDDTLSPVPNDIKFVSHRHNQSVFSILCKRNDHSLAIKVLADETFLFWDQRGFPRSTYSYQ